MEYQIWRQLIQILSFRNDLITIIKPFFDQLNNNNNNEIFNLNEEKHISFLKSFSNFQLKVLLKYEIINEKIYNATIWKNKVPLSLKKLLLRSDDSDSEEENQDISSSESGKNGERNVEAIIQGDKVEELQRLIREKGIEAISPLKTSFNEIEKMEIPIIIYTIIQKASKCFKYLLINGLEDPTITMKNQSGNLLKEYEWDCMGSAIYYGEVEIMTILEEKGIEKGNKSAHIEAAILSYRNTIAKKIIKQAKENYENMIDTLLNMGLIASVKNNNIEGAELLINNGANINAKNIIYQIIILFYF